MVTMECLIMSGGCSKKPSEGLARALQLQPPNKTLDKLPLFMNK